MRKWFTLCISLFAIPLLAQQQNASAATNNNAALEQKIRDLEDRVIALEGQVRLLKAAAAPAPASTQAAAATTVSPTSTEAQAQAAPPPPPQEPECVRTRSPVDQPTQGETGWTMMHAESARSHATRKSAKAERHAVGGPARAARPDRLRQDAGIGNFAAAGRGQYPADGLRRSRVPHRMHEEAFMADDRDDDAAHRPSLSISAEKVYWIATNARRFDVKDVVTEPDPGSNPSDDGMREVLEDHTDDPVVAELNSEIRDLNEEIARHFRSSRRITMPGDSHTLVAGEKLN